MIRILQFTKKYKKIICVMFALVILLSPLQIFAYGGGGSGGGGGISRGVCDPGALLPGGNYFSLNKCFALVGDFILKLVSLLTGIAGLLLNFVMRYTVIDLKQNIQNISAINEVWGVIRDLVNISFIFILLYAAIKTILGIGDKKVREVIVGVVIAAILINFSMFFTKVMVDASNTVAVVFYKQIAPNASNDSYFKNGIADKFMNSLRATNVYVSGTQSNKSAIDNSINIAIATIFGSIILIIVAFTLFAGAIMFLIRFVNIILLLMLSAFGFFGAMLPAVGEQAKKWWKTLTGELLFAPLYMILIWMVLKVIGDANFFGGEPEGLGALIATEAKAPSPGGMSLIMNFIIVIVLLNAVLIISKQVAGQGGSAGAIVVGKALGGTGWVGRQTVGRGFGRVADSGYLKGKAAEGGVGGLMARLALKGSRGVAGSSFDSRAMKGATVEGMGTAAGKGGYAAAQKERIKKEREFAESLKPSAAEEARNKKRKEELEKERDEIGEEVANSPEMQGFKSNMEEREKEISTELEDLAKEIDAGREKIKKEMSDEMSSAEKELERLKTEALKMEKSPFTGDKEAADKAVKEQEQKIKDMQDNAANTVNERFATEMRGQLDRYMDLSVEKKRNRDVFEDKLASEQRVATMDQRAELNKLVEWVEKDGKMVQRFRASQRPGVYADTLEESTAYRILHGTAGIEAAKKIRTSKTPKDQIIEAAKKMAEEEEKEKKEKEKEEEKPSPKPSLGDTGKPPTMPPSGGGPKAPPPTPPQVA